jgi:hypothetical protein
MENTMFRPLLAIFRFSLKFNLGSKPSRGHDPNRGGEQDPFPNTSSQAYSSIPQQPQAYLATQLINYTMTLSSLERVV